MTWPSCLFAYGTLLRPDVWREVAGRPVESVMAWCQGYVAYQVQGVDYPGLIPGEVSERTLGRVFFDLDRSVHSRLDAYEGSQYDRRVITVETVDGRVLAAWGYLWKPQLVHLLSSTRWVADDVASDGAPR